MGKTIFDPSQGAGSFEISDILLSNGRGNLCVEQSQNLVSLDHNALQLEILPIPNLFARCHLEKN